MFHIFLYPYGLLSEIKDLLLLLLLFVVRTCRNEAINVTLVTCYKHFLICIPKFCINQAIKVTEGDFFIVSVSYL